MRPARIVGVAALAAGLLAVPAGHAAPACDPAWPSYQHDAARTGAACGAITALNASTLVPRWFLPTSGAVTAEPAVVDGRVYVGDGDGVMRAVDAGTGTVLWTFDVLDNKVHADQHAASYGYITSSAAVADVPHLGRTVFFGGGGTVYALDARTGKARWAVDLDPTQPKSPEEVESSPVVVVRGGQATVYVGTDTNEAPGTHGGVVALDGRTGTLQWKYDAEDARVVHSLSAGAGTGHACGDVWSSPSVDAARGLLFFAIGNCNEADGASKQGIFALRLDTGQRVWAFLEPTANHGPDTDFGAAPVLVRVKGVPLVVQAGKSGWVYAVDERTGRPAPGLGWWQAHAAAGGSIGGFIGSVSTGKAGSTPALFGDTAVPEPATSGPSAPDPTDPARPAGLHALDLATGKVLWHAAAQGPAYAPTTYTNGVVFAPSTVDFTLNAYDAATGLRLLTYPLGAAPSGGVAVSGDAVFFGTGTYFSPGTKVPPQATGLWSFGLPTA